MDLNEANLKNSIADIVKEFKANGNFDQFRKDSFSEIISQSSFQNLVKTTEDYVQKILREQSHITKKNDLRDLLRRKLNESSNLNNGINSLINQTIDPKIENNFKPIIDVMVNNLSKQSENAPESNASSSIKQEPSVSSQHPETSQKPNKPTPSQLKISIEDFLATTSTHTSTNIPASSSSSNINIKTDRQTSTNESEKSTKVNKIEKQESVTENKQPVKLVKSLSVIKKSDSSPITLNTNAKPSATITSKPNTPSQPAKQIDKKPNEFVYLKNPYMVNELPLEADDKKVYNFNWKLESSNDKNLAEDISDSSFSSEDSGEMD